jgi:hypothetical protein
MTSLTTTHSWPARAAAPAVVIGRTSTLSLSALLLVVWGISLSRSLFDPIGFDQGLYQYLAERALLGERMYADIWDQNGPGIVAVHLMSTKLVGSSPLAFRVFDALWQACTLIALAVAGARVSGRGVAGLLAAVLYALAYYSTGYVHNGQREAFTVLPLVLACLLTVWSKPPKNAYGEPSRGSICLRHALAGALCVFVVTIKPPLGLCFGMLWLIACVFAWQDRRQEWPVLLPITGLTLGFCAALGLASGALIYLDWWEGFFSSVILRQDVPGYIRGPELVRELIPWLLPAAGALFVFVACAHRRLRPAHPTETLLRTEENWRVFFGGMIVFTLLLTLQRWDEWFQFFIRMGGLLIPAGAALLICPWRRRPRAWCACACMMAAATAAMLIQGRFFLYHGFPLLAFAALLTAHEILSGWQHVRSTRTYPGPMLTACLAGALHLGIVTWGWMMTIYTTEPYMLADHTLDEHYDRITRHKPRYPIWSDITAAAQFVRERTAENEPVACLINEPRLYYLARRPCAHRLVVPNVAFRPLFDDFLITIVDDQTRLLLARRPDSLPDGSSPEQTTQAIFDEAVAFFGPSAESLRPRYQLVAEFGDICVLERLSGTGL